jgi:NAD(P)-dependent dehydrogenase (short-subunit alcohol dehydrogenase family)
LPAKNPRCARRPQNQLGALCTKPAPALACDAANPDDVERLFRQVEREIAAPDLVVYSPAGGARGPFTDLVPQTSPTRLR